MEGRGGVLLTVLVLMGGAALAWWLLRGSGPVVAPPATTTGNQCNTSGGAIVGGGTAAFAGMVGVKIPPAAICNSEVKLASNVIRPGLAGTTQFLTNHATIRAVVKSPNQAIGGVQKVLSGDVGNGTADILDVASGANILNTIGTTPLAQQSCDTLAKKLAAIRASYIPLGGANEIMAAMRQKGCAGA